MLLICRLKFNSSKWISKSSADGTDLIDWLSIVNGMFVRLDFLLSGMMAWNLSGLIIISFFINQSRSSHPEGFLVKGFRKICSKFTGEHSCRSVISIKLQSSFIEITLRHGCSPVNLLHIFRTPFTNNTSERLLMPIDSNITSRF